MSKQRLLMIKIIKVFLLINI